MLLPTYICTTRVYRSYDLRLARVLAEVQQRAEAHHEPAVAFLRVRELLRVWVRGILEWGRCGTHLNSARKGIH